MCIKIPATLFFENRVSRKLIFVLCVLLSYEEKIEAIRNICDNECCLYWRWLMKLLEMIWLKVVYDMNGLWSSRKINLIWEINDVAVDYKNFEMIIHKLF